MASSSSTMAFMTASAADTNVSCRSSPQARKAISARVTSSRNVYGIVHLPFTGFELREKCRLVLGDLGADDNQGRRFLCKRLELPPSGDEVEQRRPCGEADESLGPHDHRAQAGDEALKAVTLQDRRGDVAERLHLGLVTMAGMRPHVWRRVDLGLAGEAEQHVRVHAAALRGQDRGVG